MSAGPIDRLGRKWVGRASRLSLRHQLGWLVHDQIATTDLRNFQLEGLSLAAEIGTAAAGAEAFVALRPRLRALAYRFLGSMVDAEDVVQVAWLRWAEADRESVADAEAYLRAHWQPGDLVITMSCGNINLLNDQLQKHGEEG